MTAQQLSKHLLILHLLHRLSAARDIINPLYAQDNGVLRRSGHTEAAVDLCKLSGCFPAGVLMEIMNEDGTMARMPDSKSGLRNGE